jgi:hypothetical protein
MAFSRASPPARLNYDAARTIRGGRRTEIADRQPCVRPARQRRGDPPPFVLEALAGSGSVIEYLTDSLA